MKSKDDHFLKNTKTWHEYIIIIIYSMDKRKKKARVSTKIWNMENKTPGLPPKKPLFMSLAWHDCL